MKQNIKKLFLNIKILLSVFFTLTFLINCGGGGTNKNTSSKSETKVGYINGNTFNNKEVTYTIENGLAIFEGDIVLGTAEELEKSTSGTITSKSVVISGNQYRWNNAVVPYQMAVDLSQLNRQRINDAILNWKQNTNIRFILRTKQNQSQYLDFILIKPFGLCNSNIGRRGGQQIINLAENCSGGGLNDAGGIIHEFGHAIGLWHEQSREDRGNFIQINWNNILSGKRHNFEQHISDGDDIGPYDYDSIMHYHSTAFGIEVSGRQQITIVPTNPTDASIGQRNGLSVGDRSAVDSLYSNFENYDIYIGDYDGNGTSDFMYMSNDKFLGGGHNGEYRYIKLSNGDGTFGRVIKSSSPGTNIVGYDLDVADYDGNGSTDYMYISNNKFGDGTHIGQYRSVWLSNGDGTFKPRKDSSYTADHFDSYEFQSGDFNGDNIQDIMYITSGNSNSGPRPNKGMYRSIFFGKTDGTFGPRIASSYTADNFDSYEVHIADFNNDGFDDFMYITSGYFNASPRPNKGMYRSVFLSNGDGTFGSRIATAHTAGQFDSYDLQLGDFNGDGSQDFMYITSGNSSSGTRPNRGMYRTVFINNGNGTFAPGVATSYTAGTFDSYDFYLGDFNGDNNQDFMYITRGVSSVGYHNNQGMYRSVFLSNGDGTFATVIATSYTADQFDSYDFYLGNFNNDGIQDYMYITSGKSYFGYRPNRGKFQSVFLGNNDGSFGSRIMSNHE